MMVTASPADEPKGAAGGIKTSSLIVPLLATLDSKGVVLEDRVDAYLTLTERLKSDEQQNLSEEICQHTSQLTRLFCVDVMNESVALSQAALQALGFCVYHQDISRSFSEEDSNTVIKALCNALLKTEEKNTCTRALWCLSKQNFTKNAIRLELHSILCAVEHALVNTLFKSMTVEHEAVNVIIKLLEQVYEDMPSHSARWAKLIYPLTVHSAHKIRERSALAMQIGLNALQAHRAEIIPLLVPDLKAILVPEMMKLFAGRQELHVLRIWGYFVSLLGKALHKGGSLINSLLGVVEQGFKHPAAQVKKAAFSVWVNLIKNFAMEPEILYNAKRLKVLMQPLKSTSAKSENVAHCKLNTWWYLAQALGPRLASNFDLVCGPLLESTLGISCSAKSLNCPPGATLNGATKQTFGTPRTPKNRTGPNIAASPATPRLNLAPGTPGSKNPIFKSVQFRGVEMLARLLGQPALAITSNVKSCDIATEPLQHDLISSPTVFMKLAPSFISVTKDVIMLACSQQLGNNISEDLLLSIWLSLVTHVSNMVKVASKRDSVEVFNKFLCCLQNIVEAWPTVNGALVLKLLESVSCHIPIKVLGSPSYHTSCAGAMHGTPALLLIQMLCSHHMEENIKVERFFSVYETCIEAGMSTPSTILGFAQSVVVCLNTSAAFVPNTHREALWRLWNRLVQPLLEHVIQSNEVNQGDSLDHDFSAMYACLKFPVEWLFCNGISEGTLKTVIKTWSELYQAFARCAALVTTAQANQCGEELASRVLRVIGDLDMKPKIFEASIHLCQVIVDNLDFSEFASIHGRERLTPSKWNKKKVRPLGNLHSIVKLLDSVISVMHKYNDSKFTTFTGIFAQVSGANPTMTSALSSAIRVVSTLFSHISQPGLIASMLAVFNVNLAVFYRRLAKLGSSSHVYNTGIQQKLEKLWIDILTSIQTRYAGPYDNHFLVTMAPLLETTFLHPKRTIKDHTLMFWNATFATVATTFEYPESLRIVLSQLKEKTPIILPGWSQSDNVDVVNETPISQLIESETSQSLMGPPSSVIPNFGGPSPIKLHGSFLKRSAQAERLVASSSPDRNRGRSPGRLLSPERGRLQSPGRKTPKRNQSPGVAAVRRKLPVDEDSMQFVTIAPSLTEKRVLTEHQKDVLRTRRTVIPGLYNDLEQSQDTQAFTDMFSQTQTQMTVEPEISNEPQSPIELNARHKQVQSSPKKIASSKDCSSSSISNMKVSSRIEPQQPDKKQILSKDFSQVFEKEKAVISSVKECFGFETMLEDALKCDKKADEDKNKADSNSTGDETSGEVSMTKPVGKEQENIVKDTDLLENIQENELKGSIVDAPELMTPLKKSSGITKHAEMLLSQEVTPPKTSSSPVNHAAVIVTPVIKLQKMSMRDILRYSPKSAVDSTFSRLDVNSSPKIFSSSDEKEKTQFKRQTSDEVRSSPRLKSSQECSSSVDSEALVPRSCGVKKSLSGKQQCLLSSQADLAELAERFELDGIEPLDDGADVSQTDNTAIVNLENDTESNCQHRNKEVDDMREEVLFNETGEKLTEKNLKATQQTSSEESMECLDSQEELIPDASADSAVDGSAMETDEQSDYFTADESECEGSAASRIIAKDVVACKQQQESEEGKECVKNQKPDFVLSTIEELSEPGSNLTLTEGVNDLAKDPGHSGIDVLDKNSTSTSQESVVELPSDGTPNKEIDGKSSELAPTNSDTLVKNKRSRRKPKKFGNEDSVEKSKASKKSSRITRMTETLCDHEQKSSDESIADSSSQLSCNEMKEMNRRSQGRPKKTGKGDNSTKRKKRGFGRPGQNLQSVSNNIFSSEMVDVDSVKLSVRKKSNKDHQNGLESKKVKDGSPVNKTDKASSVGLDISNQSETESSEFNFLNDDQIALDGKQKKSLNKGESQCGTDHLDNSCEDMFGSYNPDANKDKTVDLPQNVEESDNSIAALEMKTSGKKLKRRRSFTKLSRKRNHSPCSWDEDDDVPLAKITHCYLDVDSQSSEESDIDFIKDKTSTVSTNKANIEMTESVTSPTKCVSVIDKEKNASESIKEQSSRPTKKRRKRKSPRFESLTKSPSPQSVIAKKVLRRALKSPIKLPPKSSNIVSPLKRKSCTPTSDKKRSPIATRLRAGKLTPRSARQLLSGNWKMSPKKLNVKAEHLMEAEDLAKSMNVSFSKDLPLNQYIKKSTSPEATSSFAIGEKMRKSKSPIAKEPTKDTTQNPKELNIAEQTDQNEISQVTETSKNANDADERCVESDLDEKINSSQTPEKIDAASEPKNTEAELLDPKVGQSLQSLPQRLQFVMLTGRSSPTECVTPPERTSPVVPHKFSPRSCSSPVAIRRASNQGSPRQPSSPSTCEIPGVFSPSVSPSSGILKRRDSPSPSNKSRRVSFAEPIEMKRSSRSSPQSRRSPTSSPSRCTTTAPLLPSPLVTTTSSRVVSLQSKFITTPSKQSSYSSKIRSISSSERTRRHFKKQSLKVMNTRMLFSRGARAILASKGAQCTSENGGTKMSKQEQFEKAALDSMTRGLPVTLSPSSPSTTSTPSPTPSTQDTPAVLTQGTQSGDVDSSLDVDFESQEAVFPDLGDCEVPVEKILHQLTSSMWVHGLGQLVRARNILTVGHLCSLSPGQVKSLPIRSPKVGALCQVMERFKKCQLAKHNKDTASPLPTTVPKKTSESEMSTSNKTVTSKTNNSDDQSLIKTTSMAALSAKSADLHSDDTHPLEAPSLRKETGHNNTILDSTKTTEVENYIDVTSMTRPFVMSTAAETSSSSGTNMTKRKSQLSHGAFKNMPSTSGDTVDGIATNIVSDDSHLGSRPGKRKRDDDDNNNDSSSLAGPSSPKRQRMVDQLGELAQDLSGDMLQSLSTDKLFQAHRHVNQLMDSIMAALKTKCRSPSLNSS